MHYDILTPVTRLIGFEVYYSVKQAVYVLIGLEVYYSVKQAVYVICRSGHGLTKVLIGVVKFKQNVHNNLRGAMFWFVIYWWALSPDLIIIIMYIYHALINTLSARMIHINLTMIFYTHVEHSPTETIYIKYF